MNTQTKKCIHCKNEIPGDAKVCPVCHKKQISSFERISTGFLSCIIAVSIGGLIFFNKTVSRDDVSASPQPNQEYSEYLEEPSWNETLEEPAQNTSESLQLGQTANLDGVDVTVNSISEWDGGSDYLRDYLGGDIILLINMTIRNNTSEEISTSEVMLNGYADNMNVDQSIEDDDILFSDHLIPGSYETGNVGFRVPKNWQTFQLRMEKAFNGKVAFYTFNRSQLTPYQNKHHDDDHNFYDD